MNIIVCYVVVTHGPQSADLASRFVASYHEFPPGIAHDTLIICNGGPLSTELATLFSPITARLWPRANDPGWDISAYIDAAKGPCSGYDMMLCLGESNYFHRKGWLARLVEAWNKYGVGMYGPYSSNAVRGHLNTTAFCCHPRHLGLFPKRVYSRADRYEFEHGEKSLWRIVARHGMPVRLVTWDGEWEPRNWRAPQNILWRGDQSNCLMWCNHSERYAALPPDRKRNWEASTNRPFK